MTYTDLMKNTWHSIYDTETNVVDVIEQFFHPNYQQCINGVILNRSEYIQHVLEQKTKMIIGSIDYKYILEKENELFTIYYPKGKNNDGLPIEAEVIAYFRFEAQKIFRIHGQVRLIHGNFSDVDMNE